MNFKQNCWERYILKTFMGLLGTAVLSVFSIPAMGVQVGDSLNYSFTGTMVLTTPCSVNNDQPVTVTFGNVGISKIDSGRYVKDMHYAINCGGATSTNRITLIINATPEPWNAKAMVTSVDGLGVQIIKDGVPVDLNSSIDVSDPMNPPALQLMLVKDPAAMLTEQDFTATGTLIAEYV